MCTTECGAAPSSAAGLDSTTGASALLAAAAARPLFMAIRDTRPRTTTISPLYRAPVCLDVRRRRH